MIQSGKRCNVDLHTYLCSLLDRNDRMTMGASIECRVPFLDYRLVEGVAAMPSSALFAGRKTKHLLRQSIGQRLPPQFLRHRKWGFGVPWTEYLCRVPELRERVNSIHRMPPMSTGPFKVKQLKAMAEQFLRGDTRNQSIIVRLFMIGMMEEAYKLQA